MYCRRMRYVVSILFQAVTLLLLAGLASAQKYNLTGSIKAVGLVASNEPPGVECDKPGICSFASQTIPARNLWYWCGFKTTHRTIYTVTSINNTNITMYMMRQSQLQGCALPNVTFVAENCKTIPESSCNSNATCNLRLFGLVFPDDSCFVIINNKAKTLQVSIKVNNFFDRPRYYGTVFVIFFSVVGGLAIISNVAWQFYSIIVAPVSRHHEPIKVKREDPIKKDVESVSSVTSATTSGAVPVRIGWYQRIMTKLRPMQEIGGHKA
ncbi:hypothetical protein Vretimale_9502 [Volvox reticuliferus]|uniref:Uncharacterized protein n=1 Tax=Volvox reticuliferus TaxID=1737510 RepID=A0A8J4FXV2_9CHLO|nr:hypothetical protein Vretifemale_18766 [Volvox reticuliferus]GIM05048.1 hypothetical protein Vretimale_9502 [Volvox reticuliferus]